MSKTQTASLPDGTTIQITPPTTPAKPQRILVLQRGWVYVGDYAREGDDVILTDSKVIRRWGTTAGLGQLAASGKQPNTVLDPSGTVRVHVLAIVAQIDVAPGVRL